MKHLLFETRFGEWFLTWFERTTGLAIVTANDLAHEKASDLWLQKSET